MARPSKSDVLAGVLSEALAEFDDIQSQMRQVRIQCADDRRFYSVTGAQWEGPLAQQFDNRPRFEVNKVHLAVMRLINEYRNNRITVDFVSKDGSEDDDLAELCDGLYRADEIRSVAEEAYDNAFEEAVGGGFGAWRLCAEYEDEYDPDNDHQRISIEPIFDADTSVYFDLNAKRQDKSDATRCFVVTAMSPDAYKAEWGDDPVSWPKNEDPNAFLWWTPEVVYVAEYYRVEDQKTRHYTYRTLTGQTEKYTQDQIDADPDLLARLADVGTTLQGERVVKRRRVHKYILSGGKILEDCGLIAGPNIPIVPVFGKRWWIGNVEQCCGAVRFAKDAQRIANMQRSLLGELAAKSPQEKPIFVPEQMIGHEMNWARDNIDNNPFLLLNPVSDSQGNLVPTGPVGYTKPPSVPPAMAALLQITEQDLQDLLGGQDRGEEMMPQMSGKAVELIQNRLDMQAFIYMSNMAKAVKRSGEIWLGMAREILADTGRAMKAVSREGKASRVVIKTPILNTTTGETDYQNDIERASFEVFADVGPTSTSQRAATFRSLMAMLQVSDDPETRQILISRMMMLVDGEGLADDREFFRKKLVAMGVVQPTDEEKQEMQAAAQQAQQPDPQAMLLQAAAMEAQAKAIKAQADTALSVAKTQETEARTAETLAGISLAERDQALRAAEGMARAITRAAPAYQG